MREARPPHRRCLGEHEPHARSAPAAPQVPERPRTPCAKRARRTAGAWENTNPMREARPPHRRCLGEHEPHARSAPAAPQVPERTRTPCAKRARRTAGAWETTNPMREARPPHRRCLGDHEPHARSAPAAPQVPGRTRTPCAKRARRTAGAWENTNPMREARPPHRRCRPFMQLPCHSRAPSPASGGEMR
jgi:hypothetical protein